MATVKAILRIGKVDKRGEKQVQLRVKIGNGLRCYGLNINVAPELWDDAKGRVKAKHKNSAFLNNSIGKYITEVEDLFIQFVRDGRVLTINTFNDVWLGVKKLSGFTFKEWFDLEVKRRKDSLNLDSQTLATYNATFTHFNKYKPNIMLTQIDTDTLEGFEAYLLKAGLQQVSVSKHLVKLRIFILRAFKKGVIREYPYADFKIKDGVSKLRYLNEDSQKKLFEYKPVLAGEQLAYDRFLFACFTGLRYGNLNTLRMDEIAEDFTHIRTATLKSADKLGSRPLFIPLLPQAVELLKKYTNGRDMKTKETIFPSITNQQYNKHLKAIALKAKINQVLTTHVARHTFGTMANQSGLDDRTIADLLGQTDLRSTRIYSQVTERKLTEEMKKLKY